MGYTVGLDFAIVAAVSMPVGSERNELLWLSHGSKAMVRGWFQVAFLRTIRSDMAWLFTNVTRFVFLGLNLTLVSFL